MKLHYMGKFNLDPNTLPQAEHKPGATEFKEADSMKKLAVIANAVSFVIFAVLVVSAYLRLPDITRGKSSVIAWGAALLGSLLILFPHELLHAVCFKNDVYLYTNFKQGMLFVVGTEPMSKGRFIFMSMLPNIVFGIIPYALGMIFPQLKALTLFGMLCTSMGAGDYYNVFNAIRQVPKNGKIYMSGMRSYWYVGE